MTNLRKKRLFTLFLLIGIITFVFVVLQNLSSYRMLTSNMSPTIPVGTVFKLKKIETGQFRRYDIVGVDSPKTHRQSAGVWVFRVLGMPNESIKLNDGGVFINNRKLSLPDGLIYKPLNGAPFNECTLGDDELFLVGDNSDNARDSRLLGPIQNIYVVGKVDLD